MNFSGFRRFYLFLLLVCLAAIYGQQTTSAQLLQLPGAVEPGRKDPQPLKAPPKPAELEWSVQLPPGAEPPAALKAEKLTLNDLKLLGVTVYRREQLVDLFQPLLGKEITFDQFYGVSRAIQARYRKDGYILSFSYVPPQTVEGGVFTITVVEGFVERVQINDVGGPLKETLAQHLAAITLSRPLNVRVLERYLLLANDLAGLKVTGVLRPSEKTRGAAVLVAKVHRRPVDGGVNYDNRGSAFSGPLQTNANIAVNSAFGTGERISITASEASFFNEKTAIAASYRQPIGSDGARVDVAADYSESNPGSTLKTFDVKTTSLSVDIDASYPVIRSREKNLTFGAGLTYRNTKVDLLGAPFNRDRLNLLRAGVNYSDSGFLGGSSRLVLGLTQSVPILAATDPAKETMSRADANRYFTKANLDISHVRSLYRGIGLRLSATAQYSRAPTPSSEEFSLGGDGYGRAYNSGELTGEDGVGVSAELSYDPPLKLSYLRYLRTYGFYDFGKAWDKSSSASLGLKQSLSSAGLGFRAGFPFGLTLRLEYAYPLTREPSNQTGEKHGRLFFFTGWSY